nr:neurotoxin PaID [Pseudechis australis]
LTCYKGRDRSSETCRSEQELCCTKTWCDQWCQDRGPRLEMGCTATCPRRMPGLDFTCCTTDNCNPVPT